jgi:hypothetical protein
MNEESVRDELEHYGFRGCLTVVFFLRDDFQQDDQARANVVQMLANIRKLLWAVEMRGRVADRWTDDAGNWAERIMASDAPPLLAFLANAQRWADKRAAQGDAA